MECIYCAVRTEYLAAVRLLLVLKVLGSLCFMFYGANQVGAGAHSWHRLTPETSRVGFRTY